LLPFDEYNIVPYFAVADTLISEASSTVFDFLAISKTGIIYDLDCDNLKHSDGMPLLEIDNRKFLEGAFVHINSPTQIYSAIEKALNPTQEMIEAQNKYREELFYMLDGKSADRMIQVMEKLYYEGGHENEP